MLKFWCRLDYIGINLLPLYYSYHLTEKPLKSKNPLWSQSSMRGRGELHPALPSTTTPSNQRKQHNLNISNVLEQFSVTTWTAAEVERQGHLVEAHYLVQERLR